MTAQVLVDERTVRIPLIGVGNVALIDASDQHLVQGLRWRLLRGHNGKLYASAYAGKNRVYMHRLIAGAHGYQETDHRNGDGLDNRRANLRPASASQNRANTWKPRQPGGRPSTSTYKGVSLVRDSGKWRASIRVDQRSRNLGCYASELEAAKAYDAAALDAWGEFALVNFPAKAAS